MTWNEIMEEHGLPSNTFWSDFQIAEAFGAAAVRETYNRTKEWRRDTKMYTALVFALNYRSWYWSERNETMCKLYIELYEDAWYWGLDNFKNDDLSYFINTLD